MAAPRVHDPRFTDVGRLVVRYPDRPGIGAADRRAEVTRVDHRATVEDMRRVGRHVERQVLAQAATWHCGDRVNVEGAPHDRVRLSVPGARPA